MNTQKIPHRIGKALLAVITILFMNMITDITAFKNLHAGENQTKTQTEVNNISPKQAKDLMDKEKDVFVLDVRTVEEYKEVYNVPQKLDSTLR